MTLTKGEFNQLLAAELPRMRIFAFSFTRRKDKAEDLVQDAAERVLRYKDRFEAGTQFGAWCYVVMLNTFRDGLRKEKAMRSVFSMEELPLAVGIDGRRQDGVIYFKEALLRLTVDERELLIKAGLGYSYEELSATLCVPEGTVKSRVSRARQHLETGK